MKRSFEEEVKLKNLRPGDFVLVDNVYSIYNGKNMNGDYLFLREHYPESNVGNYYFIVSHYESNKLVTFYKNLHMIDLISNKESEKSK